MNGEKHILQITGKQARVLKKALSLHDSRYTKLQKSLTNIIKNDVLCICPDIFGNGKRAVDTKCPYHKYSKEEI